MKGISTLKYVLLIIVSSFFSCTETDNDLIDIDLKDFLNKNNGTEWLLSNKDLSVFIRLNNNPEKLIEQWEYHEEQGCYEYNSNIFSPGTLKILENNSSELRIEGDPVLSDYECMTFTRQGDSLKVTIRVNEWQKEFVYFTLATMQVDELTLCEGEEGNKIDWIY